MRFKIARRMATVAAVAALAAGGLGLGAESASASSNIRIDLNGTHGVGVYSKPDPISLKTDNVSDLFAPAWVASDCFVSGKYIGSGGNVWYHVYQEHYSNGSIGYGYGYVYAPYVDDSNAFRQGLIRCPWKP